jgi:hypothetical protein
MGKLGPNEFLLRLAKDSSTNMPAEFSSELGLTTREVPSIKMRPRDVVRRSKQHGNASWYRQTAVQIDWAA